VGVGGGGWYNGQRIEVVVYGHVYHYRNLLPPNQMLLTLLVSEFPCLEVL